MAITLQISHQDATRITDIKDFDLPIPRVGEHFEISDTVKEPTYVVCGVYHCFSERRVILWVRTYSEYTKMIDNGENPLKY